MEFSKWFDLIWFDRQFLCEILHTKKVLKFWSNQENIYFRFVLFTTTITDQDIILPAFLFQKFTDFRKTLFRKPFFRKPL